MSTRGRFQRSRQHAEFNEESAELILLRANHSQNLLLLNELFPDWSDEDLLFTLQDTYGDLDLTVSRISEGYASQWGEVKTRKPKKTSPQNHRSVQRTSQASNPDLPNSQSSAAKKQPPSKVKSVYLTDEKGRLVPANTSTVKDSTFQPSSEETLCETLDLPTYTDWAQDLPSPSMTTYTNTNKAPKDKDRTRSFPSEGKSNRNSSYKIRNNDNSESGGRNQGSSKGQKTRGRGGKSSQGTGYSHNNSGEAFNESPQHRRRNGQHSANPIKNSTVREKNASPSPKPAPVPINTWAKVASRATQPKVSPGKNDSESKEATEIQVGEDNKPSSSEAIPAETTSIDVSKIVPEAEITSESISSGKEFSALALIESLTNSERQQVITLPKPASPTRPISGVLIPNITAAKMGDISRKFGKMNLSDLGFDSAPDFPAENSSGSKVEAETIKDHSPEPVAEAAGEAFSEVSSEQVQVQDPIQVPVQVPVQVPTSTGENSGSSKDVFEQPDVTPGLPEVKAPLPEVVATPEQESKPKPRVKEQTFTSAAPPMEIPTAQTCIPSKSASQVSSQPPSAAQTQDSLYQQPANPYYQHSQGYSQTPMASHGAPGHQLPMQGQANYMTYYPYPYAPSPYNPYQANNYTHQFAQKSLNGNYEDSNSSSFGPLAQGAVPSHPQENSNVTNHSYDKSSHNKHKGYPDSSSDAGIPGHGPPMNYNGFGYPGMPSYQPSGTPGEGPIYYPHPYYTQPNHHTMFPGYPGSTGLQHAPPHLQQIYGSTHPLQQHHQGQQPQSQQQSHYSSHQQTNPIPRYQNWNN